MTDHPRLRRALDAFSAPPAAPLPGTAAIAARAAELRARRLTTATAGALALTLLTGTAVVFSRPAPGAGVASVTPVDSPSPSATPSPAAVTASDSPSPTASVTVSAAPSPSRSGPVTPAEPSASRSPSKPDPRPASATAYGAEDLVLALTVAAAETPAAQDVRITARAQDEDGEWVSALIEYGDGAGEGMSMSPSCAAPTVPPRPYEPHRLDETKQYVHAYRTPGTYTVRMYAESARPCHDGTPRETATATVTITVLPGASPSNGPRLPWLSLDTYPPEDAEPTDADLGVRAADEDGWVERISIDWGDGTAPQVVPAGGGCTETARRWPQGSHESSHRHRYATPGSYTVTVTAVTSGCDGRDEQTVRETHVVRVPYAD